MKMIFSRGFNGELKKNENSLSINAKAFQPYDLTMAGLVSCLYATFLDVLYKEELRVYRCEIEYSYHKREEYPYTLDKVDIKYTVDSSNNVYELREALKTASKNCSMYYTISQVSDINLELEVKPKISIKLF